MDALFDNHASNYDVQFSASLIGTTQRKRFWDYALSNLQLHDSNLLELNCGTGIDALCFAEEGARVVATDISNAMLQEVKRKAHEKDLTSCIVTRSLDMTRDFPTAFEGQFDVVLSNFGGLNCLSIEELHQLAKKIFAALKKEGELVITIMPKFCVLDIIYRMKKLQLKSIVNRLRGKAHVHVTGNKVPCYYYNPKTIEALFSQFQKIDGRPIGFIPSYMESYFNKRPAVFERVKNFADRSYSKKKYLTFSDHYFLHFKKI